ncbi:MAG: hypothetical protein M1836_004434 [Candelina mexicana]|nr:MAG: hypothetical protein M1836_004434 [Candelina mexicana]
MAPTLRSATRRNGVIPVTPFCFLALPPELRNMVYRFLLVKCTTILLDHNLSTRAFCSQPHETKISPSILCASNQVYSESSAILYGENTFSIPIDLFHCFPIEVKPWVPHRVAINGSREAYSGSATVDEDGIKMMRQVILHIDLTLWEDYRYDTTRSDQPPRNTRCLMAQMRAATQLFIQGGSLKKLKLAFVSGTPILTLERLTEVLECLRLLRKVKLAPIELDVPVPTLTLDSVFAWTERLTEEIAENAPFVID